MTNSLFLFGNGLGMSIDPQKFSLSRAIQSVWDGKTLNNTQKDLVRACLDKEGEAQYPQGEMDLEELQAVLFACERLIDLEEICDTAGFTDVWGSKLLNSLARDFPDAIRRFNRGVASEFCVEDVKVFKDTLNSDFVTSLGNYVCDAQHRTDVAVLNYDDLLYRVFKGQAGAVFDDYHLRDGFSRNDDKLVFNSELSKKKVNKYSPQNAGWYMHLHGSPLFITDGESVVKIQVQRLTDEDILNNPTHHIVLTYSGYKQKIIDKSPILRDYWAIFTTRLTDAQNIILFGYGGLDPHVNTAIREKCPSDAKIRIVEWADPNTKHQDPCKFWKEKLGRQINQCEIIRLGNIQEFRDWAMPT